jgi:signal transduction histidine kinase
MECPRCQQGNPTGQKFCGECGEPLKPFDRDGQAAPSYADLQRSLTEALEQQTATSDILRVISRSQTDVQPVFDAILASAVRLLGAYSGSLTRRAADQIELVALTSTDDAGDAAVRARYPQPLHSEDFQAQALRDRAPLNIADVHSDLRLPEATRAYARARGWRSAVMVPMLHHGEAVGTISVTRRDPGGFTDDEIELLKTFADQAVIAIENVRLFTELEARNRDLTLSLDRQTATADVLRIIAQSPTELQPVLDAIAASAVRLCAASDAVIERLEGDRLYNAAHVGTQMKGLLGLPLPLTRRFPGGRAILDRKPVIIDDIQLVLESEFPDAIELLKLNTIHSVAEIPMLSEGGPLGSLAILRAEVRPFTEAEVALLKTFADQAVIAIENVRLFTELQQKNAALTEALEQQTATSEILRVISRSPTDVQPVFDTLLRNAVQLCNAVNASLYRFDGQLIHLVANHNLPPALLEWWQRRFPRPPGVLSEVLTSGAVMRIADVYSGEFAWSEPAREGLRAMDAHSALFVPLRRQGQAIGAMALFHRDIGAFSDQHVALLETFADQAVIAIENVRLFTELQTSNRELTTALDTQTATSDILRVISRSQTDVQPVFEAIVASAVRLLRAYTGGLTRIVGDQIELAALTSLDPAADATMRTRFPAPVQGASSHAVVIRSRASLNVADTESDPRLSELAREAARARRYRSMAIVPMVHHDDIVGTISVTRVEPGGFDADEIALLDTFADQAVIAIENARLLTELQARTRELEVASQHKSEFLANMSHELRTPLNAVIGFSEVLTERMFGELNEKQDEYLKDIYASGQHLLSLINDILDLSKIEAGRMELELADFHLPQAIENALVLVRERALRRGIALEQSIDPTLGEMRGDERKVKQVLLNLLSNAIKFTPEGGRIGVQALSRDAFVEVSVSDTGVGIAPADQEAIFEEFRQVGTAAKKVEGTGLGLTLSRKFVELHGGRIWVESQLGTGSTFTFTLPTHS